jgi:hypothetical protein
VPYSSAEDQRASARRHYERNAAAMKRRAAVHREIARQRNRDFIAVAKTGVPCADCGIAYPHYVMQFDHLADDKDRDVATLALVPVSLARLQAEIAKCEIVCANCHAERTYRRRTEAKVARVGFEPRSQPYEVP